MLDELDLVNYYHIPRVCQQCGGVLVYKGVGEYHCEDCKFVDYDDYGKVRLYIEKHRGATAAEIEVVTGVSQKSIRQMLRESRIEVTKESKVFLHCEACGKEIRSGRYCSGCEMSMHRSLEEQQRQLSRQDTMVYGKQQEGDEGRKRFRRDK